MYAIKNLVPLDNCLIDFLRTCCPFFGKNQYLILQILCDNWEKYCQLLVADFQHSSLQILCSKQEEMLSIVGEEFGGSTAPYINFVQQPGGNAVHVLGALEVQQSICSKQAEHFFGKNWRWGAIWFYRVCIQETGRNAVQFLGRILEAPFGLHNLYSKTNKMCVANMTKCCAYFWRSLGSSTRFCKFCVPNMRENFPFLGGILEVQFEFAKCM